MDPGVQFEPTPLVPALQFFEGVDMSGMAMKAGLRPGDFLLQINGVDVRHASHDQVVELIQTADDTITLKVITVDQTQMHHQQQQHYSGTMPSRSRNNNYSQQHRGMCHIIIIRRYGECVSRCYVSV